MFPSTTHHIHDTQARLLKYQGGLNATHKCKGYLHYVSQYKQHVSSSITRIHHNNPNTLLDSMQPGAQRDIHNQTHLAYANSHASNTKLVFANKHVAS